MFFCPVRFRCGVGLIFICPSLQKLFLFIFITNCISNVEVKPILFTIWFIALVKFSINMTYNWLLNYSAKHVSICVYWAAFNSIFLSINKNFNESASNRIQSSKYKDPFQITKIIISDYRISQNVIFVVVFFNRNRFCSRRFRNEMLYDVVQCDFCSARSVSIE